ncbi:UvrD-helicase domain-containing protein [Rhodovulum sp. YNF3179]|uniref:UvrD-helicase domain-containing protein n=1 Tax=Rhodovulum sp. YNF3179 TaxID=3425127 RepID=UPI003D352F5A
MKYVCIDDGAVSELISGRHYQSIDFKAGEELIKALSGTVSFVHKLGKVTTFQDEDGVFMTTKGNWKKKKYLVIDCEESLLFTQLRESETLTSFQKLLRFCAKYWNNGIYNNSEKIITGTSKAVVFPLPYSPVPFRITLEREPLKERLKKRELGGHFLLAYKSGWEGASSPNESPDTANFRKVIGRLSEIYSSLERTAERLEADQPSGSLTSTKLEAPDAARPAHMPFEEWLPLLTDKQRAFVFATPEVPHRLQGPAGTGKTLSLLLRTIYILREAERKGRECRGLLVTHSEATKDTINEILSVVDTKDFKDRDPESASVSLSVETLASLCAKLLNTTIKESEFVDRDAQDSKILQQLYVESAISEALQKEFPSFKPHLSDQFREFIQGQAKEIQSQIFQHEISVQIKGRSGERFDIYKNCPPLKYGLPVNNEADRGYAFSVYRLYQDQLENAGQFDTDDVVISAIGQLDTPIWRRRREREGFDFIAIDETHLFNINELHVFHHFSRRVSKNPISFTVDQAQAVGDRGWGDVNAYDELLENGDKENDITTVNAVFRNAPHIREFCQSILASGATLFTNFENTLLESNSTFTAEEERRSCPTKYKEYTDDDAMVQAAFQEAEKLAKETQSGKARILITTLSDDLLSSLKDYAEKNNKPTTVIERRGDYVQLRKAEKSGHFVLAHSDFVGGLEFNAVVIVGVDEGRVPVAGATSNADSRSFANYAAHNRLYVAASRARFALLLMGVNARGSSSLLKAAAANGLVEGTD